MMLAHRGASISGVVSASASTGSESGLFHHAVSTVFK